MRGQPGEQVRAEADELIGAKPSGWVPAGQGHIGTSRHRKAHMQKDTQIHTQTYRRIRINTRIQAQTQAKAQAHVKEQTQAQV